MILGIDPGLSGALACMGGPVGSALTVFDMPTHELTSNGKKRRMIDLAYLAHWFELNAPGIKLAIIENVHAMPAQGVTSSFKFGRCFGVVEAMVAAHFIPVQYVTPQKWKGAFGLTADKDAARAAASKLMPRHAHLWPNKGHDGRAEAALLALYGSKLA